MTDSNMTSIPELVTQFLDTARGSGANHLDSVTRQADLMYELDTLVSDFLDQNQMSGEEFHNLEQEVLNSIAEDLISERNENDSRSLDHDELGNFDAESVFAALDLSLMDTNIEGPSESFSIDAMDG